MDGGRGRESRGSVLLVHFDDDEDEDDEDDDDENDEEDDDFWLQRYCSFILD